MQSTHQACFCIGCIAAQQLLRGPERRAGLAQDRRYVLLLGGFVEESAVLKLGSRAVPDAELSASVDVGSARLTGTVSHPQSPLLLRGPCPR